MAERIAPDLDQPVTVPAVSLVSGFYARYKFRDSVELRTFQGEYLCIDLTAKRA